jgi:hypothetical protein
MGEMSIGAATVQDVDSLELSGVDELLRLALRFE